MIIGAPIRGLVSALMYTRDSITIDPAFFTELNKQIAEKNVLPGGTITIAARKIIHASGYVLRLTGYKVVIVADEYDANGGSIDVSGTSGANGGKGANGAAGYASAVDANCKNGQPGGAGGSGKTGSNGMPAEVYCRHLYRATVTSRGGNGGNGGAGGNGGDGGSALVVVTDPEGGKHQTYVGTAGGNGGKGGNGAAGAPGGQVIIRYIERKVTTNPTVSITGGAGGTGGAAGLPGKGFYGEPNGQPGIKGANAAKGADGTSSVQQVNETSWWEQVRTALGSTRCTMWAEYRTRTGDYFLRRFAPANPAATQFLPLASNEFRSVLWLKPGDPRAQVTLSNIAANITPAGFDRGFYLTPDFPQYEKAYTDYAPMVQIMISDAKDLLVNASQVQYNKNKLAAEMAHIQQTAVIVESERLEAATQKLQAEGVVASYEGRLTALQAEIEAKQEELAEARLELGGQFISSVLQAIGAVAAVVGAVYTGGASLAALPGLMVAAQDSWGSLSADANGEVKYKGTFLTDWIEWKDGKAELKKEIKDLGAGMEKVINSVKPAVNATLDLIDKVKVLNDIGNATVDGELQSELKELLRRKAELEFERAQARLGVKQAELRLATIELKAQQAQADIAAAQQMLDTLSADNKLLGRVTSMLVRRAQEYMTHLQRFQFWTTRALDIYAMTQHTAALRFDTGWIHPDVEEDAYTLFARGDSTKAKTLMDAYLTTWSGLPALIALRNQYESYRMELKTQSQYWIFGADHAVTQALREKGSAEFAIALSEIYAERFECKIEGVSLALSGAASTEPTINCVLMHRGESSAVRLDGTIVQFSYPPTGAPVGAVKTAGAIDSAPVSSPESFWGRSPAAKWRLYVEPAALAKADLSSLSEVVINFRYKAFMPALQSAKPDVEVAHA